MSHLTLYAKPGCHLCEEARDVIATVDDTLPIREVDITQDPVLTERYGLRIPVLADDAGQEIAWPFGPADVLNLLNR